MRASLLITPAVATLVGFAGTVALVIAAAQAVGATPAQTSSWIGAVSLATALSCLVLTLRFRMPIVCAWSTPGLALIAATNGVTINAAVGAFLLAALLIMLVAAIKPIGVLISRIPATIASAMLAGILFRFAAAVFEQAQASPKLVFPLLSLFLILRLFSPIWAVLSVLFCGVGLAYALGLTGPMPDGFALSQPVFIAPSFEPAVLIGLGLPLFLVTMASQNLPGIAVLKADGYEPPAAPIFAVTGFFSFVSAFFGASTSNLGAIAAAICTGPDTHPDKDKRWPAGVFYGLFWAILAVFGASTVGLFAVLPKALVGVIAGLALIGSLTASLGQALAQDRQRFAALLTFVVAASGMTIAGIGSAFWGLAFGIATLGLDRLALVWRPRA